MIKCAVVALVHNELLLLPNKMKWRSSQWTILLLLNWTGNFFYEKSWKMTKNRKKSWKMTKTSKKSWSTYLFKSFWISAKLHRRSIVLIPHSSVIAYFFCLKKWVNIVSKNYDAQRKRQVMSIVYIEKVQCKESNLRW